MRRTPCERVPLVVIVRLLHRLTSAVARGCARQIVSVDSIRVGGGGCRVGSGCQGGGVWTKGLVDVQSDRVHCLCWHVHARARVRERMRSVNVSASPSFSRSPSPPLPVPLSPFPSPFSGKTHGHTFKVMLHGWCACGGDDGKCVLSFQPPATSLLSPPPSSFELRAHEPVYDAVLSAELLSR